MGVEKPMRAPTQQAMGKPSKLCSYDLNKQWEWHLQFRDLSKNMWRTSYVDMTHNREVTAKSNKPSGYGGHVAMVKHDVIFTNTSMYANMRARDNDTTRMTFPNNDRLKAGLPNLTEFTRGPKAARVEYFDCPWGTNKSSLPNLSHKYVPKKMLDYVKVAIDVDGDDRPDIVIETMKVDLDGDGVADESVMVVKVDDDKDGEADDIVGVVVNE